MKLKILLLLFYFQIAFSQNTFPYPENASIGIGTTTPQAKLHVNNGDNSYELFWPTVTKLLFHCMQSLCLRNLFIPNHLDLD